MFLTLPLDEADAPMTWYKNMQRKVRSGMVSSLSKLLSHVGKTTHNKPTTGRPPGRLDLHKTPQNINFLIRTYTLSTTHVFTCIQGIDVSMT